MPPRHKLKPDRDPKVTRITRADARANPAVLAAVNATALASRGLGQLPTAEEIAAVEATVVDDRNNRPPPPPKSKTPAKLPGMKPPGIGKTGKKESKKARFKRRQKEKAKAAKKAAKAAAETEKVEAAKAIEAVDAAKALEAIKAAEAAEAAKVDGPGGRIDGSKDSKKTKSKSRKSGGPLATPIGGGLTGGRNGEIGPKISGAELQNRLKGVDWAELGEDLATKLFNFVRAGGTVEEWKKKRVEDEVLKKLTEEIGQVSSEEIVKSDGENENSLYESLENDTEPQAKEDGGYYPRLIRCPGRWSNFKVETGPESGEVGYGTRCPDSTTDSESEIGPESKREYGYNCKYYKRWHSIPPLRNSKIGDQPKTDSEAEPESEGESDYNLKRTGSEAEPESEGESDYNLKSVHCIPPLSDSEDAYKSETESDSEIEGDEGYGSDGSSIPLETDCPGDTDPDKYFGCGSDTGSEDGSSLSPIIKDNKIVQIQRGDSNPNSSGSDARKSGGKSPSGKKRKAEDSPEHSPAKKTKYDGYHTDRTIICLPPKGCIIHRGNKGADTAESGDPSKARKPPGRKRKGDDLPEPNPSKRSKRGEGIICELPEVVPKKTKRGEGFVCALPEVPPMKRNRGETIRRPSFKGHGDLHAKNAVSETSVTAKRSPLIKPGEVIMCRGVKMHWDIHAKNTVSETPVIVKRSSLAKRKRAELARQREEGKGTNDTGLERSESERKKISWVW
ncbi:hypothetical protein V493_05251 [Pseudogymnoascus sp. VKM F-4281 (FW-2241)]|nr:hypothetical protein V493_05251 [Pseudogymnoascus sp. VKM F-4281 (FW-2241)]